MTLYPGGLPDDLYAQLCALVARSLDAQQPLDAAAVEELGVDFEAAFSVRSQMHMRRVKKTAPRVRQDMARLRERWLGGEGVLSLSRSYNYPPYLLARLVIEAICGVSKAKVSEMVKRPDELLASQPRLRNELACALANDMDHNPASDRTRRIIGAEYEFVLQRLLRARRIPFESEDELRVMGLAKTPDVRLGIPLGVRDPRSGTWCEINWIDSKAMFGDPHTFEHEHHGQLESYVHRYGPGMVLYWFGFAAAINLDMSGDSVVVAAEFPEEILFPGAESATELPLRLRGVC